MYHRDITRPFQEELLKMIERMDYVMISRAYMGPEAIRLFAYRNSFWVLERKDSDAAYVWNGKGEDPRARELHKSSRGPDDRNRAGTFKRILQSVVGRGRKFLGR